MTSDSQRSSCLSDDAGSELWLESKVTELELDETFMKTGFEVESSGQIQTLLLDHGVTVTMIFIIHCPPELL